MPEKNNERVIKMDFFDNGLKWTDAIEKDSEERALIPEGNYNARILWIEKGEFHGSAKLSACPKAMITMILDTGETPTPVTVSLLLHRRLEWKLKEFFRSVGRAKPGEAYVMCWDGLEGAKLRVHVGQRKYTDKFGEEHTFNEVDRFIDYFEGNFPDDPDWLIEAMKAENEEVLPF